MEDQEIEKEIKKLNKSLRMLCSRKESLNEVYFDLKNKKIKNDE